MFPLFRAHSSGVSQGQAQDGSSVTIVLVQDYPVQGRGQPLGGKGQRIHSSAETLIQGQPSSLERSRSHAGGIEPNP